VGEDGVVPVTLGLSVGGEGGEHPRSQLGAASFKEVEGPVPLAGRDRGRVVLAPLVQGDASGGKSHGGVTVLGNLGHGLTTLADLGHLRPHLDHGLDEVDHVLDYRSRDAGCSVQGEEVYVLDGVPVGEHPEDAFPCPARAYGSASVAGRLVLALDLARPRVETLALSLHALAEEVQVGPDRAALEGGGSVIEEVLDRKLEAILAAPCSVRLGEFPPVLDIVEPTVERDHEPHVRTDLVDPDVAVLPVRCVESGSKRLLQWAGCRLIFIDDTKDMSIPDGRLDRSLLWDEGNGAVDSIALVVRNLDATGSLLVDSGAVEHNDPAFVGLADGAEHGFDAEFLGDLLGRGGLASSRGAADCEDRAGAFGHSGCGADAGVGDDGERSFKHGSSISARC